DHAAEGIYAVYDLGGGTFDISILRLTKGVFEVVATGGDTQLGGDDFDALIVSRLVPAERLQALGKGDLRALHVAARAAREALSDAEQVPFQVGLSDGSRVQGLLERAEFESWAQPLVQRTLNAATRALRDAGLEREQIKGVVMVGGATRMPLVRSE